MAKLYEFTSYSEYLRSLTGGDLKVYTVSAIAKASGVQRPYLSNVLGGRAHLNTEQGYRLGDFLGFDEKTQSYLSLLIEHERASDKKYKAFLMGKIKVLQSSALKLENKLERPPPALQEAMAAEYFSSWEFCAVHILCSIPQFQKPEAMATALHLPLAFIAKTLDRLTTWGLVKQNKNAYEWASGNIHVPADSPLLSLHHRNWREQAVIDARQRAGETTHFTSVYSMSEDDYQKFRLRILDFLKDYNQTAMKSQEEKLVCFNLDYFDVI